jgi:hypothetical protein
VLGDCAGRPTLRQDIDKLEERAPRNPRARKSCGRELAAASCSALPVSKTDASKVFAEALSIAEPLLPTP